ncbi:DUF3068 domain-containing protein [Luteipulveratus mongoliensis]|uniref:DUF3068 domain-containing protein n=1 Tax=Luteipulveratus mongoliensis TaxID=571913 RepID=A0A0K1JJN8_9MICO|nr:DUF3068 domain-containing protein [Luteipulveratus mongoliensis]AKU16785.1 hypothetical protein VV02_14430 [Luteipulveratus mongoliensis]
MRKAAVVIGLGAFFLTMALLLKFYAYGKLAVIPLDQNTQQIARDQGAKFFDADNVKAGSGPIETKLTVIADKDASKKASEATDKNVVVINFGRSTDNNGEAPPMEVFRDTLAVDRHTGEAVRWSGDRIDGKPGQHHGLTIKFPFQTDKKTYQFWDNRTHKAVPVAYSGSDTIKGLKVYKFHDTEPKTFYQDQEVPRGIFGQPDTGGVVAKRYYTNDRTIWVEPETGVIIKVQEKRHDTIEIPGAEPVNAITTTSTFDDKTVTKNVDDYKSKATLLKILRFWAPLGLGILGVLAILGGLAISATGGRRGAAREDEQGFAGVDEVLGSRRADRSTGGQAT